MFYSTQSAFKTWFMSTLPQDLQFEKKGIESSQLMAMLNRHVDDIVEILTAMKVSLCRIQLVNNQ